MYQNIIKIIWLFYQVLKLGKTSSDEQQQMTYYTKSLFILFLFILIY